MFYFSNHYQIYYLPVFPVGNQARIYICLAEEGTEAQKD